MNDTVDRKISFPKHTDYQMGAVTYQVSAHFNEDGKTLKSKINSLLTTETQKSLNRIFAANDNSDI
jgi:hypothetical protein